MPEMNTQRILKLIARSTGNLLRGRPITVSFEVTYNCNAHCEHCNLGDYVEEPRLGPEEFAKWMPVLKPPIIQISGGEPMLRKDLYDIVRTMRAKDPIGVFIITTNCSILNEERYLRLREAGVDKFSISLDYPDERHNTFRHLKGNFEHISDLVPGLAKYGNKDILLACVVQSDNFRDLPRIAELAAKWGVGVNFSTYNSLRNDKEYYLIRKPEDQADLLKIVDRLVTMQKEGYPILTSEWNLREMIKFFKVGSHNHCRAGRRFLIVNPWAKLTPCGMVHEEFQSWDDLVNNFSDHNKCNKCFTAIRVNSEKPLVQMVMDSLRTTRKYRLRAESA